MLSIIETPKNSAHLRTTPWAACTTCLLTPGFVFLLGGEVQAGPKNLNVIQTDEHHYAGCYGGKVVKTPDPNELTNRFREPELRSLVTTLTQQLQRYARDHHDEYVRKPQIREQIEKVLARK